MRITRRIVAAAVLAAATAGPVMAQDAITSRPAKALFGSVREPAPMQASAVGSYAKGCLAGATALPSDGPGWEVMRLSRNRYWGHPALVAFIERFAARVRARSGWPGILIGDMAQPRGGPMLTGHASHQIGLDVDIWLTPMPQARLSVEARERMSARSVLDRTRLAVDPRKWTASAMHVIKTAAEDRAVARIFVHPAIKKAMCEAAGRDRAWLRKVRPWWGHDDHFHVRLACPAGSQACRDQAPPPPGDGCGREVESWLAELANPPKPDPNYRPPPPLRLADLPAACRSVLLAGGGEATIAAAFAPPLPRPRP